MQKDYLKPKSGYQSKIMTPNHTSKLAQSVRENYMIKPTEDLLSNIPYLNSIEEIWSWLKQQVNKDLPKNTEKLRTSIQTLWDSMTIEFIQPFINNMNDRLKEVLQNNGNFTKYDQI